MTMKVGLPDSLLGIRPLKGKNHGGSRKSMEKLPSDTVNQPWEQEQKVITQEVWWPVKVLETSITEERAQTELQVFRGLTPFHPEQGRRKRRELEGGAGGFRMSGFLGVDTFI